MNKPYIICYMMTSVDGRIDCAMTENLPGVEEYYPILRNMNFDATISGRVTAELEMAEPGKFISKTNKFVNKEIISKKADKTNGYDVIVDTKGTLLWKNAKEYDTPMIIITSEQVSEEYLTYLDEQNISYIVTGKQKINLSRMVELLNDAFGIERIGVIGGPAINTAFLDAGLLNEIDILIGAGIDGRSSFPPVFNRNDTDVPVRQLKLIEAKSYKSGAVLIRYQV